MLYSFHPRTEESRWLILSSSAVGSAAGPGPSAAGIPQDGQSFVNGADRVALLTGTRTLGRCLAGRDYVIRDRDGAVVPVGEVGELCVRGPLTMTGYLQPGGGIDEAVDTEGWRATGDLCAMDGNGVLTFRGRIREMIIRGGLNIYPAEVEQALSSLESVSESAVFGVSDARLGERVVAAVIPATDADIDITDLAAVAAARLSPYKRPVEWIVASTLPRTSTGKVRKHLLREWYEAGTLPLNCGAR
ncbi:class I adenylate-forming enzyme family protein [Mycolicibacterium sp. XJ1819]